MRSGEIAANAIIDKEYNWKKAIKDVYRYHQVVNPALFAMNIFEPKNMDLKRIQKILGWLEGLKYGHQALSRINHRLAKSLKCYPGFATFLYLSQLYAPTTCSKIEDFWHVKKLCFLNTYLVGYD